MILEEFCMMLSSRIGHCLQELKFRIDRLALEEPLEVQKYYTNNSEYGCGIWQQVDWEAFGMGNFIYQRQTPSLLSE